MNHDERIVMLALREACHTGLGLITAATLEEIAAKTPQFLLRRADGGRRQPLGLERVRKVLRSLMAQGLVRCMAWRTGYRYRESTQGKLLELARR